ncbi:MAG: hypothetical protein ACLSB9_31585 [Hydrogeniiclostridium mannosilyticum]
MIVVTHDFGVAARLCDRVAVMKDGEIIEEGKTRRYFLPHSTNIPGSLCSKRTFQEDYAESGTYHKTISDPRRGHTVFDAVSDVSIELGMEEWPPSWEKAGAARAL